jgi:hypothetical protein
VRDGGVRRGRKHNRWIFWMPNPIQLRIPMCLKHSRIRRKNCMNGSEQCTNGHNEIRKAEFMSEDLLNQKQAYLESRGELARSVVAERKARQTAVIECPCKCGATITVPDGTTTVTCKRCGAPGSIVWGAGYLAVQG